MPAMASVDVVNWARGLIGLDDPNWLSDLAARSHPGANGLVFHPYLSPSGERAPFRDSQARGSILGLSFEHEPPDIARAMLEGLSFVVRECLSFSPVEVTSLRLCGGGANSRFWCQLIADVTGWPTSRSEDSEIGTKGAYLTGGWITEGRPHPGLVGECVRTGLTYEPDPRLREVYDELLHGLLGPA